MKKGESVSSHKGKENRFRGIGVVHSPKLLHCYIGSVQRGYRRRCAGSPKSLGMRAYKGIKPPYPHSDVLDGERRSLGFKRHFLIFCKPLMPTDPANVLFQQQRKMKQVHKAVISIIADCNCAILLYFRQRKRGGGSSVFKEHGNGAGNAVLQLKNPDPFET